MNPASDFYYDVMIDKVDYCNRTEDIANLTKMVGASRKIVIYAPRRYGKSSLVKNIIGEEFQSKKNHLTLYVNFMEVQSLEHISERILQSLREVLSAKYPFKSGFTSILESFKGMTLSFGIDPSTQLPTVELKPVFENDKKNIPQIFSIIKNLASKYKLFLIFDEFQDISLIPQAAGILRTELQLLKNTPMAILGSKKQLLNKMFASNKSPFFNFGDEMSLSIIEPKMWQLYFNKRLFPNSISLPAMTYLCDVTNHVPNAICELGSYLKELCVEKKRAPLDIQTVAKSLENLIRSKESTYRFQEGQLSSKEQTLLRHIAKEGYLLRPTMQSVVQSTKISSGSIIKILTRLTNKGWIEFEENKGYRISDPLFSNFFKFKY
jgi:AAA+ ATPase superfamily predicted ATPase